MFMGSLEPQNDFDGPSVGRRKPVGHVQTSDRGEESAETPIQAGVPATVGGVLEGVGFRASPGTSHSTCNGQEVAREFRLYWRRKSRRLRGRPPIAKEMRNRFLS